MKQKVVLAPLTIYFQEINLVFLRLDDPLQSVTVCRLFKYLNGLSSVKLHFVSQVT